MQKQIPFFDVIHDSMLRSHSYHLWPACVDKNVVKLADLIYKCQNESNPTKCVFEDGPYSFEPEQAAVIKMCLRNEFRWRNELRLFWHREALDRSRIVERGIRQHPDLPPELIRQCITSYGAMDTQCCNCVNYGNCQ